MKKQVHVLYSGRVQGVGFRVTVEETALEYHIFGWVKNSRSGKVELIAEGEEDVLEQFLEALRTGSMKNFISKEDISWSSATGAFSDFQIRYY